MKLLLFANCYERTLSVAPRVRAFQHDEMLMLFVSFERAFDRM